jgi:hypothetical protein
MPAPQAPQDAANQDTPYYKIQAGVPAAYVRAYKQPLYDSEQILASNPSADFVLYAKPQGQTLADGTTRKTSLHTNMKQAGQLGVPQSFDVFGFNARLPKDISLGNFQLIEAAGVSQVFFGTDIEFLTVPIEEIPAGVDIEGLSQTDVPHIGWGITDNLYRFDVGGRSIHINPTEAFSVKISFPSGLAGITGNLLFRWYMRGILYKGL